MTASSMFQLISNGIKQIIVNKLESFSWLYMKQLQQQQQFFNELGDVF